MTTKKEVSDFHDLIDLLFIDNERKFNIPRQGTFLFFTTSEGNKPFADILVTKGQYCHKHI